MQFRSGQLVIDARSLVSLSAGEREELWQFVQPRRCGSRADFDASLDQIDDIVRIREAASGRLVGLGSVCVYRIEHQRRSIVVFKVGHMMFAGAARGRSVASRVGWRYFWRERRQAPRARIYMCNALLTPSGYLVVAHNFAHYWPRTDGDDPQLVDLLDRLGPMLWPGRWNATTRLIESNGRFGLFRPQAHDADARLDGDRHATFYARRNPDHVSGTSLPVLVPLTTRNWLSAGVNMMRRQLTSRRRRRARGEHRPSA